MVTGVEAARYAAFISYSHKDAAAARRLHARLERYRIPKRLVGTAGSHGPVPARLTPIFRDRDELPAAGDLSVTVRAALAASDALIVMCSPNAVASPWVVREIAAFRELNPGRPVLAAVVSGEPAECFPEGLGGLDTGGAPIEPLAADLRKQGDGQRLGFLKLVAGLTGVGLDALIQRDAARAIRRVTAVTLTALAATLVMAVLTVIALNARREADRQRGAAMGLVEFMLTDLRDRLKEVGRLSILTETNARALGYYDGQRLNALPVASLQMRAQILHAMGEDDLARDKLDDALIRFRDAFAITDALLKQAPDDPERLFLHAQSQYWIGRHADKSGKPDEALIRYRAYQIGAERLNRVAPGNAKYIAELGYAETSLGALTLLSFKKPAEARAHFERSLRHLLDAMKVDPKDSLSESVANTHGWLADTWFAEKRYVEARAERLVDLALRQLLYDRNRSDLSKKYALIIPQRSLARIDMAVGNYPAAEEALLAARSIMDLLLEIDPANAVWREQSIRVQSDLADLYIMMGRAGLASAALTKARKLFAEMGATPVKDATSRERIATRLQTLQQRLILLERH